MNERQWGQLRDTIVGLAHTCERNFGTGTRPAEWLHNGHVCEILGISKRTLQHYRDTGVLPFSQIGHKCYYKRADIERLLAARKGKEE